MSTNVSELLHKHVLALEACVIHSSKFASMAGKTTTAVQNKMSSYCMRHQYQLNANTSVQSRSTVPNSGR